ncbi:helix-turn-helix domain-containing protein [Streptomyces sp. NPDC021012]|uniref:helix-turn-helix domain-containing protein n=1 Tax=Streptomyces sp. NPDC021012 TaxID=3365107 RepID=UPI0037B512A5
METTETTETLGSAAEVTVPPTTAYVRVRWIADYFDVGLSTIYAAIESGELPAIGVGAKKALRVRLADVRAYEQSRQIKPKVAALVA